MSERFVIKSRAEMAEGEPCADTARRRETLERELSDFRQRGGNYSGQVFYMLADDEWAIVDLEDDWHRAQRAASDQETEEIPDDPEELAILICAIAASTPRYRESYTSDLCDALGTNVHSEAYRAAFAAWDDADHSAVRDGNEEVDAEAHASLCEARDRDHAAMLCGMMADVWSRGPASVEPVWLWDCAVMIGASPAAIALAEQAVDHVCHAGYFTALELTTEVEALIRDGWSPEE